MQAPVDFADITAETPTLLTITAEYQAIQMQFNQAQTSEQRKVVFQQWDALRRRLSTWKELTQLHFQKQPRKNDIKCGNKWKLVICLGVNMEI